MSAPVPTSGAAPGEPPPPHLLKRTAMVAATAFLAINLWTGAPLVALWVGSQVVGQTVLSMKAVFVVVIVLAVLVFSMSMALAWLSSEYDRMTGRAPGEQRLPWLRGMSGEEGIEQPGYGAGISALERVVMVSVYLAVICFLLWFFLLAGAPTPSL
jgi:preprotein translocase subunit SecG